jgi:hypothetical protein
MSISRDFAVLDVDCPGLRMASIKGAVDMKLTLPMALIGATMGLAAIGSSAVVKAAEPPCLIQYYACINAGISQATCEAEQQQCIKDGGDGRSASPTAPLVRKPE